VDTYKGFVVMSDQNQKTQKLSKSARWLAFFGFLVLLGFLIVLRYTIGYAIRESPHERLARFSIEGFAGCGRGAFNLSDEEFSESWKNDTKVYEFGYEDVVDVMEKKCPIETDKQIQKKYQYLLDGKDLYPDMDETKEGLLSIESEKKMRDYQLRFLNKEFTALK